MNLDKFTIKSQEILQEAQTLAMSNQNQQIEPAHILKTMVDKDENVIPFILKKLNVNIGLLTQLIEKQLSSYPKVSGDISQYFSSYSML